jgi:hypothetical protein
VRTREALLQAEQLSSNPCEGVFARAVVRLPIVATGQFGLVADPMYSTDQDGDQNDLPEPGDFEEDQTPEDREPKPGNAPAPGRRPSESGSPSPDPDSGPE